MERQIKTRGKRFDNGEWIVGDLLHIAGGCLIYFGSDTDTTEPDIEKSNPIAVEFFKDEIAVVDPDSVGQFTGLLDRDGKEIYEGDIITVKGRFPRVVLWDKMTWALMPTEYYHDKVFWVMNLQHPGVDWWEEFADEFEVLGNRFDNPSLLNGK